MPIDAKILLDPSRDADIRAALKDADRKGKLDVVAAVVGIAGGKEALREIMDSEEPLTLMDRGMLSLHLIDTVGDGRPSTARPVSSAGQSNPLVTDRSAVRFRDGAPIGFGEPSPRWSERQLEEMEREAEPVAVDEFMRRREQGQWPEEDE